MGVFDELGKLVGKAFGIIAKPITQIWVYFGQWIAKEFPNITKGYLGIFDDAKLIDNVGIGLPEDIKAELKRIVGNIEGNTPLEKTASFLYTMVVVTLGLAPYIEGRAGVRAKQLGLGASRPSIPDIEVMRQGLFRKQFDSAKITNWLADLGYTDSTIKNLFALFPLVAPIQDVITFTVREVYDPVRRRDLLSVPTPKDAYEKAELVGMNKELVDDYWASHWKLPAVQELNTMYHKYLATGGKEGISEKIWLDYMRYVDYEPTRIKNYEQIIFNPYSRVDVRRMHQLAVLDDKQVTDNNLWLGYDQEHAENLTLFSKVNAAIPQLTARYRNGWITSDELKSELLATGMNAEQAEIMYEKIIKVEKPARTIIERDLTKAEIIKGVKVGKLSTTDAIDLLQRIGYDSDEADFVLSTGLETIPKEPVEKTLSRADVLAGLNAGYISKEEAHKMLTDMYFDDWEADFIIATYYKEPTEPKAVTLKGKDLTKAEIIKGLKEGITTVEDTIGLLMELGYEEWEAQFIIAINLKGTVGSPETFADYRQLTEKWRKSQGMKEDVRSPELLLLETQYRQAKKLLERAKNQNLPENTIAELGEKLIEAEREYSKALKNWRQVQNK